jgi:hypothetical protein
VAVLRWSRDSPGRDRSSSGSSVTSLIFLRSPK